jgi:ATP-dependent helicase HrpB
LTTEREIYTVIEGIKSSINYNNKNHLLLPFYSKLPEKEQEKVFLKTSKKKFIFATNIAESSITIEDVNLVVDCGHYLAKEYDNGVYHIEKKMISRKR